MKAGAAGGIEAIVKAINTHISNAAICEQGCGALNNMTAVNGKTLNKTNIIMNKMKRTDENKVKAGAAGKVFKIEAGVGQTVKRGDAVVIIEAMKMEIPVVAPEDGTVASIDVAVGDAVEAGHVLATMN